MKLVATLLIALAVASHAAQDDAASQASKVSVKTPRTLPPSDATSLPAAATDIVDAAEIVSLNPVEELGDAAGRRAGSSGVILDAKKATAKAMAATKVAARNKKGNCKTAHQAAMAHLANRDVCNPAECYTKGDPSYKKCAHLSCQVFDAKTVPQERTGGTQLFRGPAKHVADSPKRQVTFTTSFAITMNVKRLPNDNKPCYLAHLAGPYKMNILSWGQGMMGIQLHMKKPDNSEELITINSGLMRIPSGRWSALTFVFEAGRSMKLRMYINGVKVYCWLFGQTEINSNLPPMRPTTKTWNPLAAERGQSCGFFRRLYPLNTCQLEIHDIRYYSAMELPTEADIVSNSGMKKVELTSSDCQAPTLATVVTHPCTRIVSCQGTPFENPISTCTNTYDGMSVCTKIVAVRASEFKYQHKGDGAPAVPVLSLLKTVVCTTKGKKTKCSVHKHVGCFVMQNESEAEAHTWWHNVNFGGADIKRKLFNRYFNRAHKVTTCAKFNPAKATRSVPPLPLESIKKRWQRDLMTFGGLA